MAGTGGARTLHVLANGLRVALHPAPHLSTATIALAVRVGSRYERPVENGISHFLEHMLFRGTTEHPTSFAWNDAFEQLGGTLSASTTADHTLFDVTVAPEDVGRAIDLLGEIFAPILSHVDVEKRVAREEILEHLDEDGRNVDADDLIHLAAFGDHPLGQPILGSEENLASFDREGLAAWHRRHYVAEGAVLAVAGAFDPVATRAAAERAASRMPAGARIVPPPFVRTPKGPAFRYVDSVGAQTDVRIAFATPGEKDPRHAALSILSRIVDDGMSARVFRTVVEDRGLAYEAFGELATYEDTGLYVLGASTAPESAVAVTESLLEIVLALRDGPIGEEELAKARTRARFGLRAARDDAGALAELAALGLLFDTNTELDTLAAELDRVTVDDVRAIAREVFREETLHVVAVGSLSEAEEAGIERVVRRVRTS
ncbi:MAG: pitrilysin family protein [Sandaracinus sp.]